MGLVSMDTLGLGILWASSILWLILVIKIHFNKDQQNKSKLQKIDLYLRPIIIVALIVIAVYSLVDPSYILAPWLSYKLLVLAFLILCGLGIRAQLRKFTPAFVDLISGNESQKRMISFLKEWTIACHTFMEYGLVRL